MRSSDVDDRGRVLYLITSDISARFLRGQLAHLIEHGYEVEVATKLSELPAAFDDGVVVHDLPFEREPNPLPDLRALVATMRLIRRVRPTIVNASTPKAGLLGMIAARVSRVPRRVYVVRGLRFETATGPARRVLRLLERLSTACATDIVYNSRSLLRVAERERTVRPGRGVVLVGGSGNGIDVEHYRNLPSAADARRSLGVPTDATVIGFVGRLTRDKGIVDLVDAIPAITQEEDITLLLVGDFEDGDPVPVATRRTIEESPAIVHVPWVADTRQVYAALDVLAFPSYREGLPNVPLEAQLCGVPVVAYAATGTVDAVHPGPPNRLIDVGDRGALRDALDDVAPHGDAGGESAATWVADRFAQHGIWNELSALYRAPNAERQT